MDFTPLCGGRDIQLTTTLKAVTPFAGLASFLAWLRHIGFHTVVAQAMPFAYRSPRALPLVDIFTAFLISVVLGASRFAHCDWLRFDTALHALLGIARFPANDAILRFFGRFSQGHIEAFFRPLTRWLLALLRPPAGGFTLDMDSTIFNREGSQEGAAKGYNPRRPGRKSHHPLLAVLAEAPFVLHAWLRSGNTAAGRGVLGFLAEALALLPNGWRIRCVRADSGFFDQALLGFLEERGLPYIIVARLTAQVKRRVQGSALTWRDIGGPYAVSSFTLKLQGWTDTRRFVVVREQVRDGKAAVGRTLIDVPGYTFRIWVTSRTEDAATLWRDYNGRATVEQRIEELKNDVHAGGFCTRRFFATEAAMLAAMLAYNLLAVYQAQVTPQSGYRQPSTLRAAVFVCGALLGRIGRKLVLRLSQTGGGLAKHRTLIHKAREAAGAIAPLLRRTPPPAPDWDIVAPGGSGI
jgi:hypothetical protein